MSAHVNGVDIVEEITEYAEVTRTKITTTEASARTGHTIGRL